MEFLGQFQTASFQSWNFKQQKQNFEFGATIVSFKLIRNWDVIKSGYTRDIGCRILWVFFNPRNFHFYCIFEPLFQPVGFHQAKFFRKFSKNLFDLSQNS